MRWRLGSEDATEIQTVDDATNKAEEILDNGGVRRDRSKSMEKKLGKSLRKHFEEMRCFDFVDEEKEALQLLQVDDTRGPFSFGPPIRPDEESEPLSSCFNRWVHRSRRNSWIKESNLGLMFRFALRRPLIPDRSLYMELLRLDLNAAIIYLDTLDEGIAKSLRESVWTRHGSARAETTRSSSSSSASEASPSGPVEDTSTQRSPSSNGREHFDHRSENDHQAHNLRNNLWHVFDDVEDEVLPLEEASQNYNWVRIENAPEHYAVPPDEEEIEDAELADYLISWGLPAFHLWVSDREPFLHGSRLLPGRPEGSKNYSSIDIPLRKKMREVAQFVRTYRANPAELDVTDIATCICQTLEPLEFPLSEIEDNLIELKLSPTLIASIICEQGLDGNCSTESSSTESSSSGSSDSPPTQDTSGMTSIRDSFADASNEVSNEMERLASEDAANQGKIPEMSAPGMQSPSISSEDKPPDGTAQLEDRDEDQRGRTREQSAYRNGSRSVSNSTTGFRQPQGFPQRTLNTSNSPPDGQTTDLWGIEMPTIKARAIAHSLKFSKDYARPRIRSRGPPARPGTPNPYNQSNGLVSKRKSSTSLEGSPPKMTKYWATEDLFARRDEDSKSFMRRHQRAKSRSLRGPLRRSSTPKPGMPFGRAGAIPLVDRTRDQTIQKPLSIIEWLAKKSGLANIATEIRDVERCPNAFKYPFERARFMFLQVTVAVSEGEALSKSAEDHEVLSTLERIIDKLRPSKTSNVVNVKVDADKSSPRNSQEIHREVQITEIEITSEDEDQSSEDFGVPLTRQASRSKLAHSNESSFHSSESPQKHPEFEKGPDDPMPSIEPEESPKTNSPGPKLRLRPPKRPVPVRQRAPTPLVPGQAIDEWAKMSEEQAVEYAQNLALNERKHFTFFMQGRRFIRQRIKLAKIYADSEFSENSYFGGAQTSSTSSSSTSALHKLFDKYRGRCSIEADSLCLLRYWTLQIMRPKSLIE